MKEDSPDNNQRILKFVDDDAYNTGMMILTDKSAASVDYKEVANCKIFMYPFEPNASSEITLSVLKQGKIYELISGPKFPCLAHDSYFKVMRANLAVFAKE